MNPDCRCPEGYPIIRDEMDFRVDSFFNGVIVPATVIKRRYPVLAPTKWGHTGDCPLTDEWILEN